MKRLSITETQGFTLIDLFVSLLLGTIVISLGGTALSSIVSANRSSISQQEIQSDASQALEFIVTEARQAQSFISDVGALNALTMPSSNFLNAVSTLPGNKEPVVVLEFALNDVLSPDPIVYFLAAAQNPWQGQALYRWGPPFDVNGDYQINSITNQVVPINLWETHILVDQVFEGTPSLNCNGWRQVPQLNATGFYACVDPEGRLAEFIFQSEAINNMALRAKAFARSHSSP